MQSLKNKYNLAILALDDFNLVAAIAAIGEKVKAERSLFLRKLQMCFKLRKVKITFAQLRQ